MRQTIYFLLFLALCICTGCNKDKDTKTASEEDVNKLQTQKLDTSGLDLEQIDINHDGKIDQRIYTKDGVIHYAVRDFNFDEVEDMREFYENGEHVRDEIDLDYDGICDLIVTYKNGVPTKKEYSIDFQGNRHGIQYFDSAGNRTEIHRDTNNDGTIDQIEYYRTGEEEPYKIEKH